MNLLTVKDVAERLRIATRTVWKGVAENRIPKPIPQAPGGTRWNANDIDLFIWLDCNIKEFENKRQNPGQGPEL